MQQVTSSLNGWHFQLLVLMFIWFWMSVFLWFCRGEFYFEGLHYYSLKSQFEGMYRIYSFISSIYKTRRVLGVGDFQRAFAHWVGFSEGGWREVRVMLDQCWVRYFFYFYFLLNSIKCSVLKFDSFWILMNLNISLITILFCKEMQVNSLYGFGSAKLSLY